MQEKLHLKILTPEKKIFEGEVDMVILNAANGQMGVLPRHEAYSTTLGYGTMRVHLNDMIKNYAIFGGFAYIDNSSVSVLADIAETPEEIDIERAKRALERAERRMAENDANISKARVKLALDKAKTRIDISSK